MTKQSLVGYDSRYSVTEYLNVLIHKTLTYLFGRLAKIA